MHSIKKELITICEEVIEHNNKPYIESEGGLATIYLTKRVYKCMSVWS